MLDDGVGAILLVALSLLGFADGTAAQFLPQMLGVLAIGQALLTDCEISIVRLIPMPAHLAVAAASGIPLADSPRLFGVADRAWVPHLMFALLEIGVVLLSQTVPATSAAPPRGGTVEAPDADRR